MQLFKNKKIAYEIVIRFTSTSYQLADDERKETLRRLHNKYKTSEDFLLEQIFLSEI